ncbi:MAG TPA: glucosamine-6-phosphate deaminase [Thermoanaerobaculia bacterium]|nr:glucosamine-6-phosphate deaminase [Thermoanaerobaculia bacterium]
MIWERFEDYEALSDRAAAILVEAADGNPRIVLGLPTGRTPVGMYDRVVQECARKYHCFQEVTTFNLDEYVGIPRTHPGSYCSFMRKHLFDHIDIDPSRVNIPDGMAPDLDAECERYERAIADAGGLGLTFLGLGRNGHIGFNEPGTPFQSRTRVVELTESTRIANAALFEDGHVPAQAITIGIGTILGSSAIVLLVAGHGKEQAQERLESGDVDVSFPASALRTHGNVRVLTAV